MRATKAGRILAAHAPQHLRAIAPLGARAREAKREGQRRLKAWAQARQGTQSFAQWQRSLAAEAWEQAPGDWMAY